MEKDRYEAAVGALLGAFVGDALGLGCHWYYDLGELRADYGDWVSDYTTSKPDRRDRFGSIAKLRYDAGLRAGDLSQTGEVMALLLESVAMRGGYDPDDFTLRLDALLARLDGTAYSGRYTDQAMRDVWKRRREGRAWAQAGSLADTAEAAIRSAVLAARYFEDPRRLAQEAYRDILLTHRDRYIAGLSLTFCLTLSGLIQGVPLADLRDHLTELAGDDVIKGLVPSFDALVQVGNGAVASSLPLKIEPPSLVCSLYGLPCALVFMLPAAYYLVHRYPDDFEMAVLSAVNGGGNNMARAALTGALSGALVGNKGIPIRFLSGLKDGNRLLPLVQEVAAKRGGDQGTTPP